MSLSGKPHLNPAEKLDAIYDMLRRAERQRRFSLGVRIALIAMLAFAGFSLATDPDAP